MKDTIIFIVGATASGKSEVGVRLAHQFNGEIISADSMQIYKGLDIGTAKIKKEEMEEIPHYLIDEVYPDEDFSVAMFKQRSIERLEDIFHRQKTPFVVGGTGLYINALIQPWTFTQGKPNNQLRTDLENIAEIQGKEALYHMLREVDPISAKMIHPNNLRRVIRAIEIYRSTGKPKSHWDSVSMEKELKYHPILVGLDMDRQALYQRIEMRVDLMIKGGLVGEVEMLLHHGYNENLVSMQGLGYKEIIKYLKGLYSYAEAIEILKRDTRRFAKRQLTWFRRDDRIQWFFVDQYEDKGALIRDIMHYLEDKGINQCKK
ncbi:MAG: tRNA (adenosine(37)-N6)-dimethylallyltransferase MiaA [Eubacteriales bacterium]